MSKDFTKVFCRRSQNRKYSRTVRLQENIDFVRASVVEETCQIVDVTSWTWNHKDFTTSAFFLSFYCKWYSEDFFILSWIICMMWFHRMALIKEFSYWKKNWLVELFKKPETLYDHQRLWFGTVIFSLGLREKSSQ